MKLLLFVVVSIMIVVYKVATDRIVDDLQCKRSAEFEDTMISYIIQQNDVEGIHGNLATQQHTMWPLVVDNESQDTYNEVAEKHCFTSDSSDLAEKSQK